jgi:hypothetical protein
VQIIDQLKDIIQKERIPVLKISNEMGISPYRMYKWLDNKGNPKHEDVLKINQWLALKRQKVPNSSLTVAEPEIEYGQPISFELHNKYINSLEQQITLLKTQITFLSSNIEASLNLLGQGQAAQLAHLKALEWYLTHQAAGKNEKKHQAELEVLGKMLAMFSNQPPEKGNS